MAKMPKTKFLILRFSSIGDIVLTTPVIRCVKLQFPNAEVHFATKKNFQSLLQNNPYVDKIHVLDGSLSTLIAQLKAEKFDYVIDLHNNLRTQIIKFRLQVKAFSFDKLNLRKWIYVKLKKNLMPNVHIVNRYMDTVASLGIQNDNRGLDYFIPEKDELPRHWLPQAFQQGFVVYAIGGQHTTKKLPHSQMLALCRQVHEPLVLIGGKEDILAANAIVEALEKEGHSILNTCGNCNLNQSASLLKQAQWVISHDTGMMHVAAALKKKVVAIWGNTVPEFGMYPYQTPFVNIENTSLNCRPCSKIGYDKCPLGHFKCTNDLSFEQLPSLVNRLNKSTDSYI
jgi:heptosyltransferase-2